MIQLFDYLKLVFSKDEKAWGNLNSVDKGRNFFMLNRFMSIKFPVQVHALSLLKIDPNSASNYWHKTMKSLHGGSTPNWIYTKTKKKAEKDKKLNLPSEEMIRWYCNKNEISRKDFVQSVEFFGETFLKEIHSLEKILKSQKVL
jgi:hypothetical protein